MIGITEITFSVREPLKVYSTKWCTDCMLAKQFLRQRWIAFEDILLENNPGAKSYIMERLGRAAKVPVIEIGDRMFSLNPFDPNRLAAELLADAFQKQSKGDNCAASE
ncbi:MAG: glutaredoxin family protein [Acidobacteriota bacterium]